MCALNTQDQGIIILPQQDYLPILIESFLINRKSQGLSPDTIELYTKKLQYFLKYCERQALTQVSQITSDFIRRYLLELSETHNPGGVHACFRPLRTMLYWLEEEEIMPAGWKNPIRRVKAPKLPFETGEKFSPEKQSPDFSPVSIVRLNELINVSDSSTPSSRGTQKLEPSPEERAEALYRFVRPGHLTLSNSEERTVALRVLGMYLKRYGSPQAAAQALKPFAAKADARGIRPPICAGCPNGRRSDKSPNNAIDLEAIQSRCQALSRLWITSQSANLIQANIHRDPRRKRLSNLLNRNPQDLSSPQEKNSMRGSTILASNIFA